MNDTRIKAAFDRLRDDVERAVEPQRTLPSARRSARRRPAMQWSAGLAAAVAAVALVVALRPPAGDVPDVGSGSTTTPPTTEAPTPTTAPPTTGTSVPPTTVPSSGAVIEPGTVVVATPDGVFAYRDGRETRLLDVVADVATGDTAGGLVYSANGELWRRPASGEAELVARVELPGEELPGRFFRLMDVVLIDGKPTAISAERTSSEAFSTETIRLHDLGSGETTLLAEAPAGEGGVTRVAYGGDKFVLTVHSEGFSWFTFLDENGREIEVTANPKPYEAYERPFVDQAVLSANGETLVYIEHSDLGSYDPGITSWLVVYDLVNGFEDRRLELPSGDHRYTRLDYDGRSAALSRDTISQSAYEPIAAFWVDSLDPDAGIVVDTGLTGTASLARRAVSLRPPAVSG